MELDELKLAWKSLDARLALQNELQLEALRARKVGRIRASLRPLFWGQAAQMLFGAWLVLIGVRTWAPHHDVPHLLLAGLSVHALGIATLIAGGVVCAGILRLDHAAPVLALQRRMAQLRRAYYLAGLWVGLPWWAMWVPFTMSLAMWGIGVDLYAGAHAATGALNWLTISLGIGALGMLGTWAFYRRAHRAGRAPEDIAAGCGLRRAQAELDALMRYTEE